MQLPQTVVYSLRSMAYLAILPEGNSASASKLSEETGIPSAYLSKVMRKLVLAELVSSQKGHGGGFRLAKAAKEICFREIMTAMDYEIDEERCAFGWDQCNDEMPCPLHPAWSVMKEKFNNWAITTPLDTANQATLQRGSGHSKKTSERLPTPPPTTPDEG